MDGLFRRASGVYVARLVVPKRHRNVIGKREFIASTGTRVLPVARIIVGEMLVRWRRRLHDLDRLNDDMNVIQVSLGSPALHAGGHLPLGEAAAASGLGEDQLLRFASERRLRLFYRCTGTPGRVMPSSDLEQVNGPGETGYIVPHHSYLSETAFHTEHTGVVEFRHVHLLAPLWLRGDTVEVIATDLCERADTMFTPYPYLYVTRQQLEVDVAGVEALRQRIAAAVTPEQVAAARSAPLPQSSLAKSQRLVSEAIDAFMSDRERRCGVEQARRVRAACEMFADLEGDPKLCDVDRDRVRRFRDVRLPQLPAHPNKIRLKYGTISLQESMTAVEGIAWAKMSPGEQSKRMTWIAELFAWLHREKWIPFTRCTLNDCACRSKSNCVSTTLCGKPPLINSTRSSILALSMDITIPQSQIMPPLLLQPRGQ